MKTSDNTIGHYGRFIITGLGWLIATGVATQASVFNDPASSEEAGWHKARHQGWYHDYGNGWVFHTEHGFLYEIPFTETSSFVWHPFSGWWSVGETTYPFIYSFRQQGWIYYQGIDGRPYFWHAVWNEWMSEEQEANVAALRELLRTLKAESEITPELVAELAGALQTLIANSTPPTQESLDALAATIAEAFADGLLSEVEQLQITAAFLAVLDSAELPEEDVANVRLAWLAVVEASHLDQEDVAEVKALVDAIIAEWKANQNQPVVVVTEG